MNTRQCLTLICLLALAGGGCRTSNPDAMARLLVQPDVADQLGYRLDWPRELPLHSDARVEHFELLGDRIIVVDTDNLMRVLGSSDGKQMWSTVVGERLENLTRPRRQGDALLVSSESHAHLYDLENWKSIDSGAFEALANTSPQWVGQVAVYGSPTGVVFGYLTSGMHNVWRFQMSAATSTDPVLAGDGVVVADRSGAVCSFNPANGDVLWQKNTHGRISAQPTVDGKLVYVASEDHYLYALDHTDRGRIAWRYLSRQPLSEAPVVIGNRVFQTIPGHGLVALDAETGKELWEMDRPAYPVQQRGRNILMQRREKRRLVVDVVDAAKGEVLETIRVTKADWIYADSAVDGNLYLVRKDGRILKLAPKR